MEFLRCSEKYIDSEECDEVSLFFAKPWIYQLGGPKPLMDKERPGNKDIKTHVGRHQKYAELNCSQAKILAECQNNEFREVKYPNPIPPRPGQQTKKYCRYHWSNGHDTNRCNALKDEMEDLIIKGNLGQYVKKPVQRDKGVREKKDDPSRNGKEIGENSMDDADTRKSRGRPVVMVILRAIHKKPLQEQ